MKNTEINPIEKTMAEPPVSNDDEGEPATERFSVVAKNNNTPQGKVEYTNPSFGERLKTAFQKLFRLDKQSSLEESVADLINEHDPEHQHIGIEERAMLNNVLGMHERRVCDVMIPRTDITAISDETTLDEIKQLILDKEHTRLPVYHENMDNITGFIHIKDIIPYLDKEKPFVLATIIRKALFVPPSMRVLDLLKKMKASRVHIGMVMDEYGGTDGLVTIEDLVEEIVGEIRDEHDLPEALHIHMINERLLEVNARVQIPDLEERIAIPLADEHQKEEFDTIGGLVFDMAGSVPEKGDRITHPSGVEFEIIESDLRRISILRVHLP